MKTSWYVAVLLVVVTVIVGTAPIAADEQGQASADVSEFRPDLDARQLNGPVAPLATGDELFRLDIESSTAHALLLGVEYVDGYYYVTSGGELLTTDPNYIFKLAADGSVVSSWTQSTTSDWGWRDLTWDGTYLYASDSSVIDQIDPATGQGTGVTIPSPVTPARALAYDPVTDHFWTANWNSGIYEINRSGTVINSYASSLGIYGLGWDMWSPGGPYLWAWSQDGLPGLTATQLDPATGLETGVSFVGSALDGGDLAGGADVAPDIQNGAVVLVGMQQSISDSIVGYELSAYNVEPPPWGKLGTCIPANEAPFAYVNQPWDWIEGAVDPDSTVNATLKRGASTLASASTTADANGWFSFEFLDGGNHVDIIAGDEISLSGGGLAETITVVDIQGWIDVTGDSVGGIVSGGAFDVWGVVCVREPFDPTFESKEAFLDTDGRFDVQFGGQVDIETDFLAQVVYLDPNGNYVVQALYPEGLDLNVLISEDRVEGVTMPGSVVTVNAWDGTGERGSATTVADETGFYSTLILDGGDAIDLVLGDHVRVSNPGHARETFLSMSHESRLQPGVNRVVGTVRGITIPTGGTQGRVDLWSVTDQQWSSQYVWIEESGEYGADFDGLVEIGPADRIRLWVSDGDGIQQASLGAILELGVNTTLDQVWGFTTADTLVAITLFRGLNGGNPQDVVGEAAVWSDATGYFSATLMHEGSPVPITPSNIVRVENGDWIKTLFVGRVNAVGDPEGDLLTIIGPAGAVVHISGFRPLPGETDSYFWDEVVIDSSGDVQVDLGSFDLQDGDIFDITAYQVQEAVVVERIMAVFQLEHCFLPLITK